MLEEHQDLILRVKLLILQAVILSVEVVLTLILSQKERQEHYLRHSLTLVALHSYGLMRLYLEIMPHLMVLVQSMLRMTLLLRGMIQVQFLVVLMKALDMNLRKMQLIMTVVR